MSNLDNNLKLLRRELCKDSILEFSKFYFPQYMSSPSPDFHKEICDLLMDISRSRNGRLAVAAPRNHAKSTLVTFFYVMWSICYSKEKFILIVSATANQAQTLLSDIRNALETNERLLEDFSDIFTGDDSRTKWTQCEIITKNNIKVAALGYGQNMRGLRHGKDRPTLIILDDVDGEKNTINSYVRERLFNWFTKSILKIGSKDANIIVIGTLIHLDSLLSRLMRPKEFPDWTKRVYKAVIAFSEVKLLWQQWSNILFGRDNYCGEYGIKAADKYFEERKDEMLKNTKVLWPENESYYKLMKIREIEGSYSFDTEKQNDPTNAKDSRYNPDKFYYWDKRHANVDELLNSFGNEYSIIGACDPSVGLANEKADFSAIIILARHKGKLYVLNADIAQRTQEDLAQVIISFCKIYRSHMEKFVIESNLFPELLVKYVRERAYEEAVEPPLKETRNTKNKELRIAGMETYITQGIIQFCKSHQVLLDQLRYFPRGDHDDGPDALEMALREAELNQTGFVALEEKKDRHGRTIDDRDYGQTTPEEDARDEDDEDDSPRGWFGG